MKLLILTNNPNRASYRQRIGNYLPFLNDRGSIVNVCQLPTGMLDRLLLFRSARHYDAVLIQKKCLNFLDAKIIRSYASKIIYDFDDAIMYSPSNPNSDRTSHMRLFKRTARMADCVIAGNDYLAEHARQYCNNVYILPTGLDTRQYARKNERMKDGKIRFVWIGSQSTLKYLQELRPVFEEVARVYRNVVLRVIADDFIELDNMPIEKHDWSLETQASDLQAGDIALAPLPDNRFSRGKCGFKILQYFASGIPVIASPVGVNTEFIKNSKAGMLARTPEEWIEKTSILIRDPLLRNEMGKAGFHYVKQFDTAVIGKKLCDFIRQTAAGR